MRLKHKKIPQYINIIYVAYSIAEMCIKDTVSSWVVIECSTEPEKQAGFHLMILIEQIFSFIRYSLHTLFCLCLNAPVKYVEG